MSLYSVAQAESSFVIATNLDTSTTEKANAAGLSVSSSQFGTVTQNASSLTGNASYDFGSDGRVLHQWGGSGGISRLILETVFKRSTNPSGNVTLVNYAGNSTLGDTFLIDINNSGFVRGLARNSSGSSASVTGSTDICDGNWHHIVWSYNGVTGGARLYVDGILIGSTNTIGNLGKSGKLNIGSSLSGTNVASAYSQATIDFAAFYEPTSTISNADMDTFVARHIDAFADKEITADPATATSLAVDPTLSLDLIILETPATASAASGDHYNSTVDGFTTLNAYLSTLPLEQWYKFDEVKNIVNYGTGGPASFAFAGNATSEEFGGLQGSGALRITGDVNDGEVYQVLNDLTTLTPEITDGDFTVAFWVKAPAAVADNAATLWIAQNTNDGRYTAFNIAASGKISMDMQTNSFHQVRTTGSICDNEWHFVVGKYNQSRMYLYVDGTLIGDEAVNYSHFSAPNRMSFSSNYVAANGDFFSVADFFISSFSAITTTVINNIIAAAQGEFQAYAGMEPAKLSFNNSFNDLTETRGALVDLRFNEASGAPENFGTASGVNFVATGGNITYGELSPNTKAYKITNTNAKISAVHQFPTGTFSTEDEQTLMAYVKIDTAPSLINTIAISGHFGFDYGSGLGLLMTPAGNIRARLRDGSGFETITTSGSYADSQYHLLAATTDGSTFKLYIDGVEMGSTSTSRPLTDNILLIIGGEADTFGATNQSKSTTIDEVSVYNYAFTAEQIFNHFQAVSQQMDWTATALAVDPEVSAGFGPTIAEPAMLADAELPKVFPFIPPMTAEAILLQPNFEAIDNTDNLAEPMEASAQGENPGWDIGENNQVLHMDASASFPYPRVLIPGFWNANPFIANQAEIVEPAISSTLGALIKATPITASGIFATPPAYILLSDDKWFVRLLEQNGDRAIEPVQAQLTNLPNQRSQDVIKGGFLAFFNSLASDITTTSVVNSIENQIPNYYFTKQDEYEYDSEGNILNVDTSKNIARSGAGRSSTTPTPLLSVGIYDNRERKAVAINNIEFALPGTSRNYSNRYYNLEFSFKTNKKDQIISHGFYTSPSPTSITRRIGVVGLSDGKIYLATDNFDPASFTFSAGISGSVTAPHPKKNAKEYLIAKTDVADGEWHHIIIQYGYEDGRTQIWVDSKLERQYNVRPEDGGTTQTDVLGFNGTNTIRPYIIGFNSSEELLRSEFETSGWNFCPGRFISSQNVLLNYAAYDKYDPIKAAPMVASTTMTEDNNGSGNKKKALLLYWWPQDRQTYLSEPQIFDTELTTVDNPKSAPQEFEGWDVFPLSVTGRHGLSDILNKSVVKTNAGYINLETGSSRMLDLINDVNIDQFDAIFFKNYPESSNDIDEYIRNEYVDKYFGLTEKDLYEQFLISLRAAVDTGVSLYVTSKQLALDLKIVKTFNFIPTIDDRFKDTPLSIEYPQYAGNDLRSIELTNPNNWDDEDNSIKQTIQLRSKYAINDKNTQYWPDRNNNMKHRVLNQVEYLTDDSSYIFIDRAFYQNDDNVDFLGQSRHYQRFEYRLNGLQIGDEFIFGNPASKTQLGNTRSNQNTGFWAVHKDDILAGIPITGQPLQYYSQNELVDNPYKDYVHSIALQPGTTLDGKGLGGKIFVSISEVFWDETLETSIVDLITDYWIDIAYENGIFGPVGSIRAIATRSRYRNAEQFISEDGKSSEKYDFLTYWSRNDDFAFTQTDQGDAFAGTIGLLFDDIEKVGKVPNTRSGLPSSTRARDSLGRFASGASGAGGGSLWFKAVTGRFTPTMNIYVPNLLTRGFWWLSDRIRLSGLVIRTTPMTASSSFANANAVPDKDTTILSQSMVSSATLPSPSNYSFADIRIAVLPMNASAEIVKPGKQIIATPMLAVSQFKNPGVATTGEEEIVLIIDNKIAEVYIREDKIK